MRRPRRLVASATTLLILGLCCPGLAGATPGPANAPEYWFDSWNVPALWAAGAQGQGITIAEIDTGVNASVPELQGRILSGTDLGLSGSGQIDREVDAFGHGTAMASIMVARSGLLGITGLAPKASILPIAVPLSGTTDGDQPDQLPTAIRYAADHGAKIISMSLGGKRTPTVDSESCSDDEQQAIYHALNKGAMLIAAIGNTGPTKNTVEDPGVCLGVVSVGAVDESGTVASFSARQPYLTMVAPGVNVPSLGRIPGQAYSGDGTSQATAIASAAAALVWSKYPNLTAREVATRMIATLDAHGPRPNSSYGYGLLDANRAVTEQVAVDGPNPVYDTVAPFLAQAAVFARADRADGAPRPAANPAVPTGRYEVGGSPQFSDPRVRDGLWLGGVGLIALLVLALRARRRTPPRLVTAPVAVPVLAEERRRPRPGPPPARPAPQPTQVSAPHPRPRPRPTPR
jgi:subtilisin family serine protease